MQMSLIFKIKLKTSDEWMNGSHLPSSPLYVLKVYILYRKIRNVVCMTHMLLFAKSRMSKKSQFTFDGAEY